MILRYALLDPSIIVYQPLKFIDSYRNCDFYQVLWEGDAGEAVLNGTEYKLLQCHWHSPSEHTLNGHRFLPILLICILSPTIPVMNNSLCRYELEIHLLHNNSLGHLAVVGIVYKLGRPDPFLAKLLQLIKTTDAHKGNHVGVVDPWDIKFGSRKYYRYLGSLTVPPCTEGVLWTIVKKVIRNKHIASRTQLKVPIFLHLKMSETRVASMQVRTVSREQVRALRDAVHDVSALHSSSLLWCFISFFNHEIPRQFSHLVC